MAGVAAKSKDGQLTIRADLTIGADGRHSLVRREGRLRAARHRRADGCALVQALAPDHRCRRASRPDSTPGQILAVFDRGDYWQCAYVIAKGSARPTSRRKASAPSARNIAALAPFLADRVGELESLDDVKLLTVAVDRLPLWHKPGLLCIGDAAHAMSPIGGVGINLAIQDAIAAANILGAAVVAARDR